MPENAPNGAPKSVYLHIPFCKRKCNYCSFVSFGSSEDAGLQNKYVEKLIEEIHHFYQYDNAPPLKTIYFGGGTPSLLKTVEFEKILSCFNFDENTEITTEVNPDSVDLHYLKELKNIGLNRLSIGVQTFDDEILKVIGRLHDSVGAIKAFQDARNAGFENISLDFIYGLPNQSLKNYEGTLKTAFELDPEHISLYGLKIEEGSEFAKKMPSNLGNEDLQAEMFHFTNKTLEKKGYSFYEISNYAKKGYESKHNLNYWNNEEYHGFGVAAHGYLNGERYSNICDIESYLKNPLKKLELNKLSEEEKLQEEIFLGFRKCEGIDISKINEKYSVNFEKKYKHVLKKYEEFILKTPNGYKLNLEGILLSNSILCEFL